LILRFETLHLKKGMVQTEVIDSKSSTESTNDLVDSTIDEQSSDFDEAMILTFPLSSKATEEAMLSGLSSSASSTDFVRITVSNTKHVLFSSKLLLSA